MFIGLGISGFLLLRTQSEHTCIYRTSACCRPLHLCSITANADFGFFSILRGPQSFATPRHQGCDKHADMHKDLPTKVSASVSRGAFGPFPSFSLHTYATSATTNIRAFSEYQAPRRNHDVDKLCMARGRARQALAKDLLPPPCIASCYFG
jgi:hypothetical protein